MATDSDIGFGLRGVFGGWGVVVGDNSYRTTYLIWALPSARAIRSYYTGISHWPVSATITNAAIFILVYRENLLNLFNLLIPVHLVLIIIRR